MRRLGIDPDAPSRPQVPFDQTEEYRRMVEQQRAARVRKAGLLGVYAEADCDLGRQIFEHAVDGRGAYLYGPCGTGKTYAAACAVRLCALQNTKAKLMTTTALLEAIKGEWDGGERGTLDRAKSYGLLALDDLGVEKPTDWAMQTITDLIDARTAKGLPTVITSNYRLGQLRDRWGGIEGDRIASRIGGACQLIALDGDDRRLAWLS